MIKREILYFRAALMFFTRLPAGHNINAGLQSAARYLPMIGILVGATGATVYYLGHLLFKDPYVAVVLSVVATLLMTGGFHEDGLADVADGFGGGWTKEKILEIMKDPRTGAYGVMALVCSLGLKIFVLAKLGILLPDQFFLIYVCGHTISRVTPLYLMRFLAYARLDGTSKIGVVNTAVSISALVFATITGFIPLAILGVEAAWISAIPCATLTLYLGWYFQKWIDGYTGDCLGATQQLNELIFYLCLLAIWNYTL